MRRNSVMDALRRLCTVEENTASLKMNAQKKSYEDAINNLRKEENLIEIEKYTEIIDIYAVWLFAENLALIEARLAVVREAAQLDAARDVMARARSARRMIEDAGAAARVGEQAAHRAREQSAFDDLVNGKTKSCVLRRSLDVI